MDNSVEIEWKVFASESLPNKGKGFKLRKPSNLKKAEPYVYGIASPSLPTKMMSEVNVHDAWLNPHNLKLAKTLLQENRFMSFSQLMFAMVKSGSNKSVFRYIWWVLPHSCKKRVMHTDNDGVNFVKMNNKWQILYSVQSVGALVGAQGSPHYESVPKNGYFVVWENEEIARKHIG